MRSFFPCQASESVLSLETLRIALTDFSGRIGGGQVALANKAYALSMKGHEIHLILGTKDASWRLPHQCSPYCHLHPTRGYSDYSEAKRIVAKANRFILDLHRKLEFDIIDAQGINGIFVPTSLRDRLVVTVHGNNIKRGLTLIQFAFRNSEIRNCAMASSKNFFKHVFGHFLVGELEKKSCHAARFVVGLTKTEADYLQRYYSVPSSKIRVVPNVVVDFGNGISEEIGLPEKQRMIMSVGSLEFIKGIPILAKAMRNVLRDRSDVVYVSVGNGPLMDCVAKLKKEFPRRAVILPRIRDGLFGLYSRSLILVHASLYEAFGLSIAEAMLAGKPVVGFNLTSIPDLVNNNMTGLLAKPASSRDLAIKTLQLIDNEEEVRRLGRNAKDYVSKNFNAQVVGTQIERVFKEV